MAAIVDHNDNLDLSQLNAELQRTLPPYARPLFIRLIKEADLTGKSSWQINYVAYEGS